MLHTKNLRAPWAFALGVLALSVGSGCATKGYVREQVSGLSTRVDSEDQSLRGDIDRASTAAGNAESEAARARMLALGHLDYKSVQQFSVPFDFDSAELVPDAQMTLDEVTSAVQAHPNYIVDLYGYACTIGTAAYNDDLSRRRASAVLSYLVQHGPGPVGRYAIVGLGENAPVMADGTEDHVASRRVEVQLLERVDSGAAGEKPVISQADPR